MGRLEKAAVAVFALLFGWTRIREFHGPLGGWIGWPAFGVALLSTVFWSTIVGLALCEFTIAHAWTTGVRT